MNLEVEAKELHDKVVALFLEAKQDLKGVVSKIKKISIPTYDPFDKESPFKSYEGSLLFGIADEIIPNEWDWEVYETETATDPVLIIKEKHWESLSNNGLQWSFGGRGGSADCQDLFAPPLAR